MHVLLVGPEEEENLSIRYLSSSLLEAGHKVDLAPFNSLNDMDSVVSAASNTDIVGLSMCFQSRARELLARRIKQANVSQLVVAGGHYASCAAEELLRNHPEIDIIVIHEGEKTFVEIADSGPGVYERLPQIKGIAYRQDGNVYFTQTRPINADLESIHPPDRRGPVRLLAGVPTASILGSRGCLSSCDYCCITTLHRLAPGRRFRQRNPESIADEMAWLFHERGIRQFIFEDDNFLVPSKKINLCRLGALEGALVDRGISEIAFAIKCRPADVDIDVFRNMKQMGLLRVFLGVESGNTCGLVSIGRKQTVSESEKALSICEGLGISSQYTVMIFHPEATIETMREDLAFMRHHNNHPLRFTCVEILAGTPLERRMLNEGRARGNYLGRYYHLLDPAADLVCTLTKRNFLKRCWAQDNLMDIAIGTNQLSEVMKHFYAGVEVDSLYKDIHAWLLEVNRSSVDLLEKLINLCAYDPHLLRSRTRNMIHDLMQEEALSRSLLSNQGEELRNKLEELTFGMVGLRKVGMEAIRTESRSLSIVRHAAAVMLALSVAGAVPSIGRGADPAPPPMHEEDMDSDGLCDICEDKIFGTNRESADTDRDKIPDGDEDHDGDGLSNLEEFNLTVSLMDAVENGDTETVLALLEYSSYMAILFDTEPLIGASYHGHTETVKALLDAGADVNMGSPGVGWTALSMAADNGQTEVIKILLDAGVNVNAAIGNGNTALMRAAMHGQTEVVEILLEAGAEVNNKSVSGSTALMFAASRYSDIVNILLNAGAKIDAGDDSGKTALMNAAWFGHPEIVDNLLKSGAEVHTTDKYGKTALMIASENGHLAAVAILLQEGADVNDGSQDGSTALMYAASENRTEVVQLLLQAGADVNAADRNGRTALKTAEEQGHAEVIQILLEAGAVKKGKDELKELMKAVKKGKSEVVEQLLHEINDIDAWSEDGRTALVYAAGSGHSGIVSILLDAEADVHATDKYGTTALMHAAYNGHTEVVQLLLQAGADVNASDNNGGTALMDAAGSGHSGIVSILLDAGADVHAGDYYNSTALMHAAMDDHSVMMLQSPKKGVIPLSRRVMRNSQYWLVGCACLSNEPQSVSSEIP